MVISISLMKSLRITLNFKNCVTGETRVFNSERGYYMVAEVYYLTLYVASRHVVSLGPHKQEAGWRVEEHRDDYVMIHHRYPTRLWIQSILLTESDAKCTSQG